MPGGGFRKRQRRVVLAYLEHKMRCGRDTGRFGSRKPPDVVAEFHRMSGCLAVKLARFRAFGVVRQLKCVAPRGYLALAISGRSSANASINGESSGAAVRYAVPTCIFEENTPDGMTVVVSQIVEEVDRLVRHPVHEKWTSKESSMKAVKRKLNAVFKRYALPRTGEPPDSVWRYIPEHY
jgi:hypothetical protein